MSCFHPVRAWRTGESSQVQFFYSRKAGVELSLPCGECVGCDLKRAQDWGLRCYHESQLHSRNEFVTLTYAELPERGSLDYQHFQAFVKSLRNSGRKLRYFGAGEYGTQFQRPHFHACLFGIGFDDRTLYKTAPSGEKVFDSCELQKHWPHGAARTGNVTLASAAYIARYIVAKGGELSARYRRLDPETGEIFYVEPEFNFMSRRPGVGSPWFAKYGAHATTFDFCVVDGQKRPVPKYYYRLFGEDPANLPQLAEIQALRFEGAEQRALYPEPNLASRELCALQRAGLFNRDNLE